MKILLVAAMPTESTDIVTRFNLKLVGKLANFYPYYSAIKGEREIFLLQTHVGSINAPAAAALALENIKPDAVIKVGCIGGNAPGLKSNTIIVPTLFFHSGAWLTRSHSTDQPTADAAQWQSLYGEKPYQNNTENLGGIDYVFKPDTELTQKYREVLKKMNQPYIEAPLGGGDMVIFAREFMSNIRSHILNLADESAPWCTDNESHAIAQLCAIYRVPFTGVYFIASSDYEDIDGYDPENIRQQTQQTILPIVEKIVEQL